MKPAPHVKVSKDKLAILCEHCRKAASYTKFRHIDSWNRELQEFIRKHNECKPNQGEA